MRPLKSAEVRSGAVRLLYSTAVRDCQLGNWLVISALTWTSQVSRCRGLSVNVRRTPTLTPASGTRRARHLRCVWPGSAVTYRLGVPWCGRGSLLCKACPGCGWQDLSIYLIGYQLRFGTTTLRNHLEVLLENSRTKVDGKLHCPFRLAWPLPLKASLCRFFTSLSSYQIWMNILP